MTKVHNSYFPLPCRLLLNFRIIHFFVPIVRAKISLLLRLKIKYAIHKNNMTSNSINSHHSSWIIFIQKIQKINFLFETLIHIQQYMKFCLNQNFLLINRRLPCQSELTKYRIKSELTHLVSKAFYSLIVKNSMLFVIQSGGSKIMNFLVQGV